MAGTATRAALTTETAIWTRLIRPDDTDLSPEAAAFFLKVEFDTSDRQRMHELALKAQEGNLTPAEREQLACYERIGTLLSILKSKARKTLRKESRS